MVSSFAPEEMALSAQDKTWISEEIRKALATRDPTGWRLAARNTIAIGSPVALVAAFVALGIFALTQWNAANKRLAEEATFQTKTGDRLDKIEESLRVLRASNSALTPDNPASQAIAKNAIAEAEKSAPLPTPIVEQVGKSFVEAAATNNDAWSVALEYAAYRSSLNAQSPDRPQPAGPLTMPKNAHYVYGGAAAVRGKPPPAVSMTLSAAAPIPEAARWDSIGADRNSQFATGPLWLFATGGATPLDGIHMRNVVFFGTEVYYGGGPVVLENITFVNCAFVFANADSARQLAQAILTSTRVSFSWPPRPTRS